MDIELHIKYGYSHYVDHFVNFANVDTHSHYCSMNYFEDGGILPDPITIRYYTHTHPLPEGNSEFDQMDRYYHNDKCGREDDGHRKGFIEHLC